MAGRHRGVIPRGQGWQVSFTLPCGTRCREIVRFPNTRKGEEQANHLRCVILSEIDMGSFDYAKRFPRSKKARQFCTCPGRYTSIKDALKSYLMSQASQLAHSTYRDYEYRIYKHLIPAFGHLSLADLTATHVREWLDSIKLTGKSKNNVLSPLRSIFDEAFRDELIDRNPLTRIRGLPITRREANPFPYKEMHLLLSELQERSQLAREYFQFAFGSGLRTSELLALTWEDIDYKAKKIFVNKARVRGRVKAPKTSSGRRIVDLRPLAEEALDSRNDNQTGAIFQNPRTGEAWKSGQTLRKAYWYPALEAIGIPRRNPYQTRHTFASHLLSSGENPMYVAQQMGHRDWGMIRLVYGRWIST